MPAEAGKTTGCLDGCCERVIHDRECKDALDAMSSDSCLSLAVKESENIAMTKEIGEALRAARRRKGLNQAEVGRLVGVSRQAVGQWENGDSAPSTRNLVQLADIYGVDVGALTSRQVAVKSMPFIGKDEPYMSFVVDQRPAFDDMPPDVRDEEVEHMRKLAEKPYEMRSDVPVRGTVIGGSEDEFILENEVIDFVRRPPGIQNARNVYALYVVNDSMIPRFEPGDLVYVSPSREPTRGDYVIVQLFNSDDKTHSENGPALIKRLRKRTAEIVVLIQFNPPTELEFHVSEIRAIHRVIPTNELFGV